MILDDLDDIIINNSVDLYLNDIKDNILLSEDQEIELFQRINDGDFEAKDILIESNLRLVIYVAKDYVNRGMEFSDLIQEGNIGLIKAVENFDYTKGYKFSTYAVTAIERSIARAINNKARNIRLPSYIHDELVEYRNIYEELETELCRKPTLKELSETMGVTIEKIIKFQKIEKDTISLNIKIHHAPGTVFNNNECELEDTILSEDELSVEDLVIKKIMQTEILKLIQESSLKEREKILLMRRYGLNGQDPISLTEIAKEENCSRQKIYMIEKRILKKLRNNARIKELSIYLQYPEKAIENANESKQKNYELKLKKSKKD